MAQLCGRKIKALYISQKNNTFEKCTVLNEAELEALKRDVALAVLKELSRDMYPSNDIFGRPTLVIRRKTFEQIRHKYLDRKDAAEE